MRSKSKISGGGSELAEGVEGLNPGKPGPAKAGVHRLRKKSNFGVFCCCRLWQGLKPSADLIGFIGLRPRGPPSCALVTKHRESFPEWALPQPVKPAHFLRHLRPATQRVPRAVPLLQSLPPWSSVTACEARTLQRKPLRFTSRPCPSE